MSLAFFDDRTCFNMMFLACCVPHEGAGILTAVIMFAHSLLVTVNWVGAFGMSYSMVTGLLVGPSGMKFACQPASHILTSTQK